MTDSAIMAEGPYQHISIIDDGSGVTSCEFEHKILQIATDAKEGGRGIGRFAALQLGNSVSIETVALDPLQKKNIQIKLSLNAKLWQGNQTLDQIPLNVEEKEISVDVPSSYKVIIEDFHDGKNAKNKISRDLLRENIEGALFARYPEIIVRNETKFIVNGKEIKAEDHLIGEPATSQIVFKSKDNQDHVLSFTFLLVRSDKRDHRTMFRVSNSGLQTVAHEFTYKADIPEKNQWFIFVDSPYFDLHADTVRMLSGLDSDHEAIIEQVKTEIDRFFSERYENYRHFVKKLSSDPYYPYRVHQPSSQARGMFFNHLAYYVEEEHKLLQEGSSLRKVIYALIDKALNSGEIESLLEDTVNLDKATLEKYRTLRDNSDLEDVITFSEAIAKKLLFINFLHEVIYGTAKKKILERKQLHKLVERNLWIFGEQYNNTPHVFSDKNLENSLRDLRGRTMQFSYDKDQENEIQDLDQESKDIIDIMICNERIVEDEKREILVVELKAPRVNISQKEMNQAERYAFQIEKEGVFSKNHHYKVILVGAQMQDIAKARLNTDPNKPFKYLTSKSGHVEVWAMEWSELFAKLRAKLTYLGNALKTKDVETQAYWIKEFPDVELGAVKSVLAPEEIDKNVRKGKK